MKIEKHQMNTKRGKIMKGKNHGHKTNYMDNLSGKQWAKQVKISENGLNNGCTGTGYKNQ